MNIESAMRTRRTPNGHKDELALHACMQLQPEWLPARCLGPLRQILQAQASTSLADKPAPLGLNAN